MLYYQWVTSDRGLADWNNNRARFIQSVLLIGSVTDIFRELIAVSIRIFLSFAYVFIYMFGLRNEFLSVSVVPIWIFSSSHVFVFVRYRFSVLPLSSRFLRNCFIFNFTRQFVTTETRTECHPRFRFVFAYAVLQPRVPIIELSTIKCHRV